MMGYATFFEKATGHFPYPYQEALALSESIPSVVSIPTGLGKTAGTTLAWVWRRNFTSQVIRDSTPRRLVYCLPMRVLVEQTRECVVTWLHALGLLSGVAIFQNGKLASYDPWADGGALDGIRVHLLMGGDVERDWDRFPERDAVLIGTQDMLLSRALNRGYATSRFRWPVQFGLLNNDCLWVMDEVQLMGSGLATTTQLQAFRRQLGAVGTRSMWVSATLRPDWLHTVDFEQEADAPTSLSLGAQDRDATPVKARLDAPKPLERADFAATKDGKQEAKLACDRHRRGTRTLVIVNTVRRATEIFAAVERLLGNSRTRPDTVLLHSRFRSRDRERALRALLATPQPEGVIAVVTQVVEAGVDVSATTLLTDLAPWSSLVQRFGRCNRAGEDEEALVIWLDLEINPEKRAVGPYHTEALLSAREKLEGLDSATASGLPGPDAIDEVSHVLRRRDLLDLFDTTQDLGGADIDVSRFIREADEHGAFVFWRKLPEGGPEASEPQPKRPELCPVPVSDLQDLVRNQGRSFWRWDHLEKTWSKVRTCAPGSVLVADAADGGYVPELGWSPRSKDPVVTIADPRGASPEGMDDDPHVRTMRWQTVAEHTDAVVLALEDVLSALGGSLDPAWCDALLEAARWHDFGKAHSVFQDAVPRDQAPSEEVWAKSAATMRRYVRPGFRHELASALAMLRHGVPDLSAYLVAAHHGKIRMSIRSLPDEVPHEDMSVRFACGVRDGDVLPATDLGGGLGAPETVLDLGYMELGDAPETGASWLSRILSLRDDPALGPFRLAYLEALIRVADWRGSDLKEAADA